MAFADFPADLIAAQPEALIRNRPGIILAQIIVL